MPNRYIKVVAMPYLYNDDVIREVRESNNIVDVISQYVELKRAGSSYKGLCPFHNEKTPSFVVSPNKQMFRCFGCGEGGDVISFLMKYENIDFTNALKNLADRANISLDVTKSEANDERRKLRDRLYELNRDAAFYYYNNLLTNKSAYDYILQRGINRKTIKSFGLGYSLNSWDGLLNYLKSKKYSEIEIEKAGLIIKQKDGTRYYDRFRNRIMFPIINTKGKVIGFGGRVTDNSHPKYLNSPDTPVFLKGMNLYGLNTAVKHSRNNKIILVEGYMDVISLYQSGINYCVASLGTALTPSQAQLLKRYSNEIYVCYDSDNAGINATDKAIEILKDEDANAKVIILPSGKDPDEYVNKFGKNDFESLIGSSLNYIDFKIFLKKKKYDLKTVDGRIGFTKDIAHILNQENSPIEIDAYINKISMETSISVEAIKDEISGIGDKYNRSVVAKDKYINTNYRYNNKDKISPVKYLLEPGHMIAEKKLLNLIINNYDIYLQLRELFRPHDFLNDIFREIADVVYTLYESNTVLNKEDIISRLSQKDSNIIKEVIESDPNIDNDDKIRISKDYIKRITYYKLKIKKDQIKDELKLIESKKEKAKGDVEKFKELCSEIIKIDKELKLHQ